MTLIEEINQLPEQEKILALEEVMRGIYRNDLMLTAKYLLHYKQLVPNAHADMIASLESHSRRALIVMPRGSFKSSISSVAYPIWLLLKNPNLRILLDSELYTNSKNLLREIRTHLSGGEIVDLFGRFQNDSCWAESEIIINQRTKNLKEASITAGGLGTEKTGQHYDVIIMDDMNSPNNSGTKEGCEKVIQHFKYCQSILEPGGRLVLVGTRYSELDLIGMVLHKIINEEEAVG